jgi:hypothetical protein
LPRPGYSIPTRQKDGQQRAVPSRVKVRFLIRFRVLD